MSLTFIFKCITLNTSIKKENLKINHRRFKMTHTTKDTFQKEVLDSKVPVLLDFWASWCAPCRMQGQILDKYEATVGDKAKIVKINVDEQPELAQQFGVMSIPTLVVMQNGEVKNQVTGVTQDAGLNRMLGI